jgi:hypothetical protein
MTRDFDQIRRYWPSPEDFYSARDHRTQLEVPEFLRYVHVPVEIHVDSASAIDLRIQQMALVAANLTARWARNTRVFVPHVPLAPPLDHFKDEFLDTRILREMLEADPFGKFAIGELEESNAEAIRLFIGPSYRNGVSPADYSVDVVGWTAKGKRGRIEPYQPVCVSAGPAAALAAAVGAADLFKRAIGHPMHEWLGDLQWCTWEHRLVNNNHCCATPSADVTTCLGNMLLAGVGAIGSSLLYILGLVPVRGRVTILDRDHVETSNLNRSLLFRAIDGVESRRKIEVTGDYLKIIGLDGERVQGTWRETGEQLERSSFDIWVSLTNEDGAWAEVPFQLPPLVLHGTTTSGWGVGFGRHIPRREDCTACRLPRPHAEFRGPCSEGEIAMDGAQSIRASLPFLSAVSASLVAIELMKLQCPAACSLPNAVYADFRVGLPAVIASRLGPTSGCRGCEIARSPLWAKLRGSSLYANLSLSDAHAF